MKVRRMREEDIEQVVELEKSIFTKPWSYKSFYDSLSLPNAIYMVGLNGDEILGYCGLYCILNEASITNVAVKPGVRNKGVGYGILRELLYDAKNKGMEAATLEVRKSNFAAIHLYEQLGFVQEGIRKDFYDAPVEDAVIMWKRNL